MQDGGWRELYRTTDAREARTVLTAIAAMEFEVRCPTARHEGEGAEDLDFDLGDAPFVVEVRAEDWAGLRSVLESLLEEQVEFDRDYEARQARKRRFERWMVVVVALGALVAMLLATMGCAVEERPARHHALRVSRA